MSKKKGIIRLVVLLAVIAFVVYTAVSGLEVMFRKLNEHQPWS